MEGIRMGAAILAGMLAITLLFAAGIYLGEAAAVKLAVVAACAMYVVQACDALIAGGTVSVTWAHILAVAAIFAWIISVGAAMLALFYVLA
jgi:hypothetical protein